MVLVQPNLQHGYYDAFLAACAKAGAKPPVAQYANEIQIKMWLISAGFGIAPTTATMAEVKRPGLDFRAFAARACRRCKPSWRGGARINRPSSPIFEIVSPHSVRRSRHEHTRVKA